MTNPDQNTPPTVVDIEKLSKYVVVGYDPALKRDVCVASPGMTIQDMGALIGVATVNMLNGLMNQHDQLRQK